MKVILAEKPSVARDLAAFLGARDKREGYLEGAGYRVTWAYGHLAELKAPDEYDPGLARWSLATLPFVPETFELKLVEDARAQEQFRRIQQLFEGADEIICATDAGREGELIFRYVLALSGCEGKPTRRLWLSSLTEAAIAAAFDKLEDLSAYDDLYAAARCRSEADWIVGLNGTRNFTVRYGRSGVLWSVGRVQTPVLALVVARDDEILAFTSSKYWELRTRHRKAVFRFDPRRCTPRAPAIARQCDAGGRIPEEARARELLAHVDGGELEITSVESKEERVQPPLLYDLTALQREMNTRAGFSAARTLELAQKLYERKLITYPRTDSRHLPVSMHEDVRGVLRSLQQMRPDEVSKLDLDALHTSKRVFDDRKVSDHHAILPTGSVAEVGEDAKRVFDAIVMRLIAAFSAPCVKDVTTVLAEALCVPFSARGVVIREPGWTAVEKPARKRRAKKGADDGEDAQVLPAFLVGESGAHAAFLHEGETKAPRAYNDASLLAAMETAGRFVDDEELKDALREKGLGTPATRAATLETLLRRNYIRRDKKHLVATDLGRYLIALIDDPQLKSAELTGDWEAKLRRMERGDYAPARFRAEVEAYTQHLIDAGGQRDVDSGVLGDCPRCSAPVVEGQRGFGCSAWKDGCRFVIWKEYRGAKLHARDVRELLQRRMTSRSFVLDGAAGERAVLYRTEQGAVLGVAVPAREHQKKPAKSRATEAGVAGAARVRGAKGGASGAKSGERKPRVKKPAAPTLCPLCSSRMVETAKSYSCSAWRDGCKFVIWKTIAGKAITRAMAKKLVAKGRTQVLKGFVSKAGKKFEARLKLEEGQVRFEFD